MSANNEAVYSVEELYDGKDFRGSLSRSTLEEIMGSYFSDASRALQDILKRNKLKEKDIEGVELIGGGTRVPKIVDELSKVILVPLLLGENTKRIPQSLCQ